MLLLYVILLLNVIYFTSDGNSGGLKRENTHDHL